MSFFSVTVRHIIGCVRYFGFWCLFFALGCGDNGISSPGFVPLNPRERLPVIIADQTFMLELALTPAERFQGLSDRERIEAAGGMLFVFPEPALRTFVMRRCLAPIDIVFLGSQGHVLNMHEMEVEPPERPEHKLTRYHSQGPALMAIEFAGGTLERLGLQRGDRIDLPIRSLLAITH